MNNTLCVNDFFRLHLVAGKILSGKPLFFQSSGASEDLAPAGVDRVRVLDAEEV
jgi:hypothetical protein